LANAVAGVCCLLNANVENARGEFNPNSAVKI